MTHSIIAPSAAGIWGPPDGCRGWPLMNQTFPELESGPEAEEGEAAHEIGAHLIESASRGFHNVPWGYFEGQAASNGVIFTEEMFEGAELYAQDVTAVMRSAAVFGGPNLGIEQRVEAPYIHELSFGTADCFVYSPTLNMLFIWDFKFGYEVVEVFENWQLLNYACGILQRLGISLAGLTVCLRVCQPRAHHSGGPIREWTFDASHLKGYFDQLQTAAAEALGPNPTTRSGKHCKHCPGRHACNAALRAGVGLYEVAGKPLPIELSPQALGVQLAIVKRAIKQLEYVESGLDEQVKALLKSGVLVPGWATETTYGREKWAKPVEQVLKMGDLLKHDLRKKAEAITPKQAKKLGIDGAVITAYSTTPRTGLKVVPDNGSKAKQVFMQ